MISRLPRRGDLKTVLLTNSNDTTLTLSLLNRLQLADSHRHGFCTSKKVIPARRPRGSSSILIQFKICQEFVLDLQVDQLTKKSLRRRAQRKVEAERKLQMYLTCKQQQS
jgi:hypothetical protein